MTVLAERLQGDEDVVVEEGNELRFTRDKWNTLQDVVVRSMRDDDRCNGSAIIQLTTDLGAEQEVQVSVADDVAQGSSGSRLCGVFRAPDFAMIDGDVNDENAPYESNDTLETAQFIRNPITVSGYVKGPGTGVLGRSRSIGDISDYYTVDLLKGHQISLEIGNSQSADLDLYLYDSSGLLIDASLGVGNSEMLLIGVDGRYVVEVFSCTVFNTCAAVGGSNYLLRIGSGVAVANRDALRLSNDFVPGEVIAILNDDPSFAKTLGAEELLSDLGVIVKGGELRRGGLLEVAPDEATSRHAVGKSLSTGRQLRFVNAEQRRKHETLLAVKALRNASRIEAADPNYRLKPTAAPNDPLYGAQRHFPLLSLPAARDITTGDDAVTVGVIDTGILSQHPDFVGQLVAGYDFISNPENALDGGGKSARIGDTMVVNAGSRGVIIDI